MNKLLGVARPRIRRPDRKCLGIFVRSFVFSWRGSLKAGRVNRAVLHKVLHVLFLLVLVVTGEWAVVLRVCRSLELVLHVLGRRGLVVGAVAHLRRRMVHARVEPVLLGSVECIMR